jgi:hypothetical protein
MLLKRKRRVVGIFFVGAAFFKRKRKTLSNREMERRACAVGGGKSPEVKKTRKFLQKAPCAFSFFGYILTCRW